MLKRRKSAPSLAISYISFIVLLLLLMNSAAFWITPRDSHVTIQTRKFRALRSHVAVNLIAPAGALHVPL